jgi:5-formyltetrahydrofolate cyclo-ligase
LGHLAVAVAVLAPMASAAEVPAKAVARLAARRLLRAIPSECVAEQSRVVCERVRAHAAFGACGSVAVYLPMADGRELDTWHLVEAMFGTEPKRVYVPKVEVDGHMRLLRAGSLAELRALPLNRWGCPEHTDEMAGGIADATDAGEIELVVVPALMFAPATLARLGRGKGFYDRFLARLDAARARQGLPPAFKLGVGFDEQMAESVPAEEHDIRMDAIVCARAVYPNE